MFKREVKKYDNGLTHIHYRIPFLKSAMLSFMVRVGSSDESEIEQWGIAHFLEHMLFNGSEGYPDHHDTGRKLASSGVTENAWTFKNVTNYYLGFPVDALPLASDVLFNRVFKPLLRDEHVVKEKGIIQEERVMNENKPNRVLDNHVDMLLFNGNTYAHPVIGVEESIGGTSAELLRKFHKKFYSPNNVILLSYGGLEMTAVEEQLGDKIASLEPQDLGSRVLEHAHEKSPIEKIDLKQDVESAYYSINAILPQISSADDLLVQMVMESYLGSGEASLLNQKLRRENSYISSLSGGVYGFRDMSVISYITSLDAKNIPQVRDIIRGSIEESVSTLSDADFNRAKNFCYGDFIRTIEDLYFPTGISLTNLERINFLRGTQFEIDPFLASFESMNIEMFRSKSKEILTNIEFIEGQLTSR